MQEPRGQRRAARSRPTLGQLPFWPDVAPVNAEFVTGLQVTVRA